jgi:hypothetical protein
MRLEGWGEGAPRLTRPANVRRFPSFLLFLSGKKFGELHRQFAEVLSGDLSQRVVPSLRKTHSRSDRTFLVVLIPLFVCPNLDNTAAHQQTSLRSINFDWLTYALRKACSTADNAVNCIACGGAHFVDPVTSEILAPRLRRASHITKSRFGLVSSYRGSLRVLLRRKARAVLPTVEAVCTGCWLVKIVEPAIMPTRNAPAKIIIIRPTGCGNGWNRLICRSKSSRSRRFICTSTQPLCL